MALPRNPAASPRDALVLFAILFLALCLRLYGLGRESLWYDEAFTLRFARADFPEMIRQLVHEGWNPPVHPTLVWAWVRLVGAGDWQTRLLSALFGTLAVLALHGLVRALFDLRTAHLAAFLAAVSQLFVAYSQEARTYALLLFLVLTSLRCFVASLQDRENARSWMGFVVLAALATLTHYYAIFVLLALCVFALCFRREHPISARRLLGGALLFTLLLLPWLASGVVGQAASQRVAHFEYAAPWFSVDALTFLRTMSDFHGGRMHGMLAPAPAWTFYVGALLFAVPALFALSPLLPRSSRAGERAPRALLALMWIVPMVCLIAMGFARVQFATRYVLFCAAPYLALTARGLAGFRPVPRAILFLAIAAWCALGLRALYTIPHKEDWRSALAVVALENRPGDCVLFLPFGDVPLEWPVYHPDGPALDVVAIDDLGTAACQRLWVLTYQRAITEVQRVGRALAIVSQRWRQTRSVQFFLVRVELWEPAAQGSW